MTTTKKLVIAVVALSIALVSVVGGTLAYLFDVTEEIENVFNPQNIDVDLTETEREYKMVPGVSLGKDPTVEVDSDIPCYVFVEVTENGSVTVDGTTYTFDEFMSYAIDSGWTKLEQTPAETANVNETYVYYRQVNAGENQTFAVLTGNKVDVLKTVTKQMMGALETAGTASYPTLTFKAYAAQLVKEGATNFTPAEAWVIAKGN